MVDEDLSVVFLLIFANDFHAVEQFFEEDFNSFQIVLAICPQDMKDEKLIELLEQSGVSSLSLGNKQMLESFQS